jgi:hypothetical protein
MIAEKSAAYEQAKRKVEETRDELFESIKRDHMKYVSDAASDCENIQVEYILQCDGTMVWHKTELSFVWNNQFQVSCPVTQSRSYSFVVKDTTTNTTIKFLYNKVLEKPLTYFQERFRELVEKCLKPLLESSAFDMIAYGRVAERFQQITKEPWGAEERHRKQCRMQ